MPTPDWGARPTPGAAGAPGGMQFPNPAAIYATLDPAEMARRSTNSRSSRAGSTMSLRMIQMSIKTMELQKASLEAMRAAQLAGRAPGGGAGASQESDLRTPCRGAKPFGLAPTADTPDHEHRSLFRFRVALGLARPARARAQGLTLRNAHAVVFRGRHAQARIPRPQSAAPGAGGRRRRLRDLRIQCDRRVPGRGLSGQGGAALSRRRSNAGTGFRRLVLEVDNYFDKATDLLLDAGGSRKSRRSATGQSDRRRAGKQVVEEIGTVLRRS